MSFASVFPTNQSVPQSSFPSGIKSRYTSSKQTSISCKSVSPNTIKSPPTHKNSHPSLFRTSHRIRGPKHPVLSLPLPLSFHLIISRIYVPALPQLTLSGHEPPPPSRRFGPHAKPRSLGTDTGQDGWLHVNSHPNVQPQVMVRAVNLGQRNNRHCVNE